MTIYALLLALALLVWCSTGVLRNAFTRLVWHFKMPFQPGDYVSIGGVGGRVEKIGWQAVQLRGTSGDLISVANALVSGQPVVQTVADSGSQGIEMHLPVYGDRDETRARLAAMEALLLSPYLALDRPFDAALELGPSGETLVRVRAGVFDASQRVLFESSIIETYRALLYEK